MGRGYGGKWGFRPGVTHGLGPARQQLGRAVDRMGPQRITRAFWAPGVTDRSGDRERFFRMPVPIPHFSPVERPIHPIAQLRTRLKPFGAEAQRHHGEMHGGAAHGLAAVLAAHHQRVGAFRDAVVVPVKLFLFAFVRGEILKRAKVRTCVQADDRETLRGQARDHRAAARARADHDEVHLVRVGELPHRDPTARSEYIGRPALDGARRRKRISGHACSPGSLRLRCPARPPPAPRSRAC